MAETGDGKEYVVAQFTKEDIDAANAANDNARKRAAQSDKEKRPSQPKEIPPDAFVSVEERFGGNSTSKEKTIPELPSTAFHNLTGTVSQPSAQKPAAKYDHSEIEVPPFFTHQPSHNKSDPPPSDSHIPPFLRNVDNPDLRSRVDGLVARHEEWQLDNEMNAAEIQEEFQKKFGDNGDNYDEITPEDYDLPYEERRRIYEEEIKPEEAGQSESSSAPEKRGRLSKKQNRVGCFVVAIAVIILLATPKVIDAIAAHKQALKEADVNKHNANYHTGITRPADNPESFDMSPEQIQDYHNKLFSSAESRKSLVSEDGSIKSVEAGNPKD